MTEDISIDNLQLIYELKQYYAKVLLSLTEEDVLGWHEAGSGHWDL